MRIERNALKIYQHVYLGISVMINVAAIVLAVESFCEECIMQTLHARPLCPL